MSVTVQHAKEIALQWVRDEGQNLPGFCGAFYHGSFLGMPDNAIVPPTSDVDVMVVLEAESVPPKPGKFAYHGVLLEVSYLSRAHVASPEQVLGNDHLAGSFRLPSVIIDASGELTYINAVVARDFAKRAWVRRRCENAVDKITSGYAAAGTDFFPDQVLAWLFPTGVTTHVLLAAGLRNPTVRKRYVAARKLLEGYGRLDFHEDLLELLGCRTLTRASVETHLTTLTDAFDAAKNIPTPFPFASDISEITRPLALEGSRELISTGLHREAVFWIAATHSRCQKIFLHAAPTETPPFQTGYQALLNDLGITSFSDLQQRHAQTVAFLPRVWDVAETIMALNPEIRDV